MTDKPKRLPPAAGMGRAKGNPNKITRELKDMILGALSDAGGQKYLVRQAEENPSAFLALVGKIIPKDVNANVKVDAKELSLKVEFVKADGAPVS